ncbi:MAG TPA: ABC transporter permease [Pseudonocardiaceae bacterium]|jgi:peptide/nickel transport system permease protein|nr:ABC transporter permease [Pseudonocardiaceae bacterium]
MATAVATPSVRRHRFGAVGSVGRRPLVRFIVKRVLQAVLVLFFVATVAFFIIRIAGDPVKALLPEGATLQQEQQLRHSLGYDRPLFLQYLTYLNNLLHFNFGQSVFFQQSAISVITQRLPATVQLATAALVFAVVVAIPAGIISAVRRGRATDSSVMAAVLIGQSTPAFFVGIVLILVFAVELRVLPASGIGGFQNLILPAVTLGLYSAAMIARLLRSSLIEVLGEDHIRTAKAKGLSPMRVIVGNGLRNAALPVVTIVGLEVGNLLGGAIITEQVFSWPGVGRLTIEAITNRDYPLVQATVLFLAVVFVGVNLIVDILYAFLDPRVRLS